nr:hypothetical protein BCU04_19540 [Vibrio cyclitrophicus]
MNKLIYRALNQNSNRNIKALKTLNALKDFPFLVESSKDKHLEQFKTKFWKTAYRGTFPYLYINTSKCPFYLRQRFADKCQ